MNGYIYGILTASVVGGIISTLVSNLNNGLKKYVNYTVALVCAIVMLLPLSNIIGNTGKIKDSISDFFNEILYNDELEESNSLIINTGTEAVVNGIKNLIIDKFNLDEKEVLVSLEIDESNIQAIEITKINVILTGRASWSDVDTVKGYLEGIVGASISVTRK